MKCCKISFFTGYKLLAWKHYALDSNLFNVQLKSFRQKQLWASWFHAILLSLLLYLILYYCNTIYHPLSTPFLQYSFTLSRICYFFKDPSSFQFSFHASCDKYDNILPFTIKIHLFYKAFDETALFISIKTQKW